MSKCLQFKSVGILLPLCHRLCRAQHGVNSDTSALGSIDPLQNHNLVLVTREQPSVRFHSGFWKPAQITENSQDNIWKIHGKIHGSFCQCYM